MRNSTHTDCMDTRPVTDDPWDEDGDDELEAEIMRADRPFGSDARGTTSEEEVAGLSLDEALARERPDERTIDEEVVIVDDGEPDVEAELVAEGAIVKEEYPSPEESALSIRDDAPGATDHEELPPSEED